MDAGQSSTVDVAQPNVLERSGLDWKIEQLGENNLDVEFYSCQEECTSEKIIFEVNRGLGRVFARNIFGECMFEGYGSETLCGSWRITLPDQSVIGKVDRANLCDNVHNIAMSVCDNKDGSYTVNALSEEGGKTTSSPLASICWEEDDMLVQQLADDVYTTYSMVKALVLCKALQLLITGQDGRNMQTVDFSYVRTTSTEASPLYELESITQIKLMKTRKLQGNTWYYHLRCGGISGQENIKLVYEYKDILGRIDVKNRHGVSQFYACGISDIDKRLSVNLHGKVSIGSVKDDLLYDKTGATVMRIQCINMACYLPYHILDLGHRVIAQITPNKDEKAVTIDIQPDLCTFRKAIILAHAFKIAYHFFEFQSTRTQPQHPTPHIYLSYPRGSPAMPSALKAVSSSSYSIHKKGHDTLYGTHYFELKSDMQSHPGSGTALVFEVTEQTGKVFALAKTIYGEPQFFAQGLWGLTNDLLVSLNSGAILGINRGGTFFDVDSEKLMVERRMEDPNVDPEDFEDCEIPLLYRLLDARPGKNFKHVAEISLEESDVAVVMTNHRQLSPSWKALILSYALKLAYNVYQIYKEPKKQKVYPYKARGAALRRY